MQQPARSPMQGLVDFVAEQLQATSGQKDRDKLHEAASSIVSEVTSESAAEISSEVASESASEIASEVASEVGAEVAAETAMPFGFGRR